LQIPKHQHSGCKDWHRIKNKFRGEFLMFYPYI
jgi:hypothetical protein